MTNKIIVSLMITVQLTMCMEKKQIVDRLVDQQNQVHEAIRITDLFLGITEHMSLQTQGRLGSTCHLFHDLIDFSKKNHNFNPKALSVILTKDFNRATSALISCAHAKKLDVFVSYLTITTQ